MDSGASVHMPSKMELTPEEVETIKVCLLPTTVLTANWSIDTTDMFVNVQLLEDTPAVLLVELCEENEYSYDWKQGQTPNLVTDGNNFVPLVTLGLSSDTDISGSAGDSAGNTKEVAPSDRDATVASRDRLQDLTDWFEEIADMFWTQHEHPLEVTDISSTTTQS